MPDNSQEMKPDPMEKPKWPPIKYGETDLSDVILIVEEQEFYVHKVVLANRSKYFKALLYGNFKEKNQSRIELKEVPRVAFRRLMDFLYYGRMLYEDEYPDFVSSLIVSNTGCGALKRQHNAVADKKSHIKNFWINCNEILEIVDRFDLKYEFQPYFVRLLDYFICDTANCFVCVTIHIFGLVNDLIFLFEKYKKHDYNFVKEWLKIAEEAKIDQDDRLSFVCQLFKKDHDQKYIQGWSQLVKEVYTPNDDKIEFLTKLLSTLGSDT